VTSMQNPCIVAELSANHGNDINVVKASMLKAIEVGCDAVKIQTYRPDTITLNCSNKYFNLNTGTIWDGMSLYDLYSQAYTPWDWNGELFEFARDNGVCLFSTPFDPTAVDLLEKCGNPIYKIASFEITDTPLISYAASMGKPMIISTGIANETEIHEAVEACHSVGNYDVTLLQCTSQYPAKIEDANLATMVDMQTRFGTKVGLSDHTLGNEVALAATALGASIIEKHFILDKAIGGPDASFSMTPEEFKSMIEGVNKITAAIGEVDYTITDSKLIGRKTSRSLFITRDVKRGELISYDNVRSVRPADGLPPKFLPKVIGMRFNRDVAYGQPLSWDMIDGEGA